MTTYYAVTVANPLPGGTTFIMLPGDVEGLPGQTYTLTAANFASIDPSLFISGLLINNWPGGLSASTITAAGGAAALVPTSVQTGSITAAVGQLVMVSNTAADATITLPNAPADKSQIGAMVAAWSNTYTIMAVASGSDVFLDAGITSGFWLIQPNSPSVWQYDLAAGQWLPI